MQKKKKSADPKPKAESAALGSPPASERVWHSIGDLRHVCRRSETRGLGEGPSSRQLAQPSRLYVGASVGFAHNKHIVTF